MATAPSLVNTMLASKSMKQKSDDEVHRQGGGQLSVLLGCGQYAKGLNKPQKLNPGRP